LQAEISIMASSVASNSLKKVALVVNYYWFIVLPIKSYIHWSKFELSLSLEAINNSVASILASWGLQWLHWSVL